MCSKACHRVDPVLIRSFDLLNGFIGHERSALPQQVNVYLPYRYLHGPSSSCHNAILSLF